MITPEEDFIVVPPPNEVGEAHSSSLSYDDELKSVWDVKYEDSPYHKFNEALKTGSTFVTESGINTKVKVSGVDFRLVDGKSGHIFKESLSVAKARDVLFKGKDVKVFQESYQKSYGEYQKKIQEAADAARPTRDEKGREILQEDFSNGPDRSGPNDGGLDVEYTPLGNGPLNQQLTLNDTWAMLSKAFEAFQHNPYAHRAIHIIVNFILGRGFTVNLGDPQLQADWTIQSLNLNLEQKVYTWMRDLERQGDLFLRPIYNIAGDIVDIINIEASTILEVITDPENVNEVLGYYQQYMTPVQIYGPGAEKSCRMVINLYSVDEILFVKINNAGSEKRGRSTLFPGLEYLKMVRDYHVSNANRAIAEACLVMDWTINGSPSDVQSFAGSIQPVSYKKPISSVYHSSAVTVQALNMSGSKSSSKDDALDAMISVIALTFGISKDYLGAVNSQTRAGSLITTEPPVKLFEQRQRVLSMEILYPLIQQWIDKRQASGAVPIVRAATNKQKLGLAASMLKLGNVTSAMTQIWTTIKGTMQNVPLDRSIHIKYPAIVQDDLQQVIENCANMQSMGWWSARRAANMATQEWGGIDTFDYDEEQDEIKQLGVKPIGVQWAQIPSIDPSNPVDPSLQDTNATDAPAPASPGGVKSKSNRGLNMRNNPFGVGATHLRKAVGGKK
jgi:hypothetical protein